MYFIDKMDKVSAGEIANWKYEAPYSIYNMDGSEECVKELLDDSFYVVKDENNKIAGFYCFGQSAQVPIGNIHGVYADKDFIDIGLGMSPDLCGKGKGFDFISKEIELCKSLFAVEKLRLTVAGFNDRAIRVYEKAGFRQVMDFNRVNEQGTTKFIVMELT